MLKRFILIEPDPIVCIDLEGALRDKYPDSQIDKADDPKCAKRLIDVSTSGTTIFIKGSLIGQHSDLARSIGDAAASGFSIVTIGKVEKLATPARFIDLPFTTDMIIEATTPAALGTCS